MDDPHPARRKVWRSAHDVLAAYAAYETDEWARLAGFDFKYRVCESDKMSSFEPPELDVA